MADIDYNPVPRIKLPVFAYEVIAGDLLVDGERRITAVSDDGDQVTAELAGGDAVQFPRRQPLDVFRDRRLMPGFGDVEPTRVA